MPGHEGPRGSLEILQAAVRLLQAGVDEEDVIKVIRTGSDDMMIVEIKMLHRWLNGEVQAPYSGGKVEDPVLFGLLLMQHALRKGVSLTKAILATREIIDALHGTGARKKDWDELLDQAKAYARREQRQDLIALVEEKIASLRQKRRFYYAYRMLRAAAAEEELAEHINRVSRGVIDIAPRNLHRWFCGETNTPHKVDTSDQRIVLTLALGLNALNKEVPLTEIPGAIRVILDHLCGHVTAENECGVLLRRAEVLAKQGKHRDMTALIANAIELRLP